MWAIVLLNVLLATLCSKLNAYPTFQTKIPNGDKVPNPCNRSTIWSGVGHQNTYGSGPRNPFGLDFAKNNNVWNRTLCQKDSDGDGMTNGQELGDPNCIWTVGSTPTFSTNLSHPGVCEPIGSSLCSVKNSWMTNCIPGKLNCPAINASGVRNYTLRFPVTPIPSKETTQICYRFALPNDSVSDIIAIEPVIDNAHILHHMVLFACTDEPTEMKADEAIECEMGVPKSCESMIAIWIVGSVGQCLNSQVGLRTGPGGFNYAILQLHWDNPEQKANLTDSSGMRIYDTNQLRPNRGQVALIGQSYLEIPSGQADVTFTGKCSSACTKKLPQSIFLTSAVLNMHLLGKSGDIRLSRNGSLLKILDNVAQFDYNAQPLLEFENPIEVKLGDEIEVKCVYQSTQRNSTTNYGEAALDEMCFGVFLYYPLLEGFGLCGQWKSIEVCPSHFGYEFAFCDFSTFMKLIVLVPSVCAGNCTSTPCALIIDGILATRCENYPDVRALFPDYGEVFEECKIQNPPKPTSTPPPSISQSSGQGFSLYFGFVLTLMAYAIQD